MKKKLFTTAAINHLKHDSLLGVMMQLKITKQ